MPKGKHHQQHGGGASKRKERAVRAAYRRERKSGGYLSPGDPDFKSFSNQLEVQGLRLQDVPGDGNCLFRALAVQLRGADHRSLRRDVVRYMREHRDEFEPFIDDQTSFEEYITQLASDGEYAGNDAIVAFARAHSTNIVIHQHNASRWEVLAPASTQHTLHIAYLNGEHYCSVEPVISSDRLPPVAAKLLPPPPSPLSAPGGESSLEAKTVQEATGCQDLELVEQSLCENSYDPQLAIVEILQLMSLSESGGTDTSNETHKPAPQSPVNKQLPKQLQQVKKQSQPQIQATRRLSNRERKAAAKTVRKQARRAAGKTELTPADPVGSTSI